MTAFFPHSRDGRAVGVSLPGMVLAWWSPNLVILGFFFLAEVRAPWSEIPATSIWIHALAFVSGGACWWAVNRRLAVIRTEVQTAERRPVAAARAQALLWQLPASVMAYLVLATGGALLVGPAAALGGFDLGVVGVLVLLGAVMIIVPCMLLLLAALGRLAAPLTEQGPLVGGWIRAVPAPAMAVVIGAVLPLYEHVVHGAASIASLMLVALMVPYAVLVMRLVMRYTQNSVGSLGEFLDQFEAAGGGDPDLIQPRAMDDLGVLVWKPGEMLREQDRVRRMLEQNRERVEAFSRLSSDFLFELDAEGRLTWVSDRYQSVTGIDPANVLGVSSDQITATFLHADGRADALGVALASRKPFRNVRIDLAAPQVGSVTLQVSATVLHDASGQFIGHRGTGTNVTDVVDAERALRKRENELAQARKMEAVGQLTGGVAHDFNNLLTAVIGNLELLTMQRPDLEAHPLLEGALSATRRGADLVGRLLAFSRRQELEPRNVDLVEEVRAAVDLLSSTLGAGVEVRGEFVEEEVVARVDPVQLEAAVINLALNGRDAMPDGGVLTIAVRARSTPGGSTQDAIVEVIDQGTGIARELLPHVAEPFFSTKPTGEGSGLGLSMVYGFARQSDGELLIDSQPGRGTAIRIILPRVERRADLADSDPEVRATVEARRARILVVEDEEAVGRVVSVALESWGHEVVLVDTAEAGIGLLKASEPFDMLLSDVVLPGTLSGVDVLREARHSRPGMPCALMSGFTREHVTGEDSLLREVPMLAKPFRLERLRDLVTELLRA